MSAFRDPPTAAAITYRCPVCGATAIVTAACFRCGRAPDARASRLPAMDASLLELAEHVHRSRLAFERALVTWQSAKTTRDMLVEAILTSQAAPIGLSPATSATTANGPTTAAGATTEDVGQPSGTGTGGVPPLAHRPPALGNPDASRVASVGPGGAP